MDLWTSIYKLFNLRVVCRSYLILRRSLMDDACSALVVLLRLAGLVHINCDSRLLDLVDGLVLLDAVAVTIDCDRVLCAGALPLKVGLSCA